MTILIKLQNTFMSLGKNTKPLLFFFILCSKCKLIYFLKNLYNETREKREIIYYLFDLDRSYKILWDILILNENPILYLHWFFPSKVLFLILKVTLFILNNVHQYNHFHVTFSTSGIRKEKNSQTLLQLPCWFNNVIQKFEILKHRTSSSCSWW